MTRHRLGVVARLPEPIGIHVQAWRRALGDPAAARIAPHLTLVPPQTVAERDLGRATALVERAAAGAVPFLVELDGTATFLPDAPVAYLAVREGGPALADLEAALGESPLDRRTHPFHPHVTLVQDLPAERIEAAARELAGFRAAFPVRELALLREEREADGGRVWRPLATATVGASTAVREVPYAEAASAALLLLDPAGGRVLLGLRTRGQGRRYPGAWDAIGGKPDEGETPAGGPGPRGPRGGRDRGARPDRPRLLPRRRAGRRLLPGHRMEGRAGQPGAVRAQRARLGAAARGRPAPADPDGQGGGGPAGGRAGLRASTASAPVMCDNSCGSGVGNRWAARLAVQQTPQRQR